jgi:hypothetical protein
VAGVPLPVEREAQDALDFVKRQKEMEQKVAKIMNEHHQKVAERLNASRKEPEVFHLGDLVWFLRPPSLTANKALPRWVGPCPIKDRHGLRSYSIEIRPGLVQFLHRSQLKPFRWQSPEGTDFPLHYFRLTPQEENGPEGEWQVEKILAHKKTRKGYEFLTKWEGYPASEATWEPIGHFFHRYSSPFVDYCMRQREAHWCDVDVLPSLSRKPMGG